MWKTCNKRCKYRSHRLTLPRTHRPATRTEGAPVGPFLLQGMWKEVGARRKLTQLFTSFRLHGRRPHFFTTVSRPWAGFKLICNFFQKWQNPKSQNTTYTCPSPTSTTIAHKIISHDFSNSLFTVSLAMRPECWWLEVVASSIKEGFQYLQCGGIDP